MLFFSHLFFSCFAFFYAAKFFFKKIIINRCKILLITSFIILTILLYYWCIAPSTILQSYSLPNLAPFFITFICFHLCSFIFICKNLFLSMIVCEYFFLFMTICENLFFFCENLLFMIICENLFFFVIIFLNPSDLWKSLLIYDHLCESLRTSFCFFSLYENKQAYEYCHLKQIFYHQNMIMIFSWLWIFQFCVFYCEFFSFCVWLLI